MTTHTFDSIAPTRALDTARPAAALRLLRIVASCLAVWALGLSSLPSPAVADELVIFTKKGGNSLSEKFNSEHLPSLLKEAFDLGLVAQVVDISEKGAPADVHLMPLIVYQSDRGRAIFQGRYVDIGKVLHFIRTQRAIPPTSGSLEVQEASVVDFGRAKVLASLKITPLAGHRPPDHDDDAFEKRARRAIQEAFITLKLRAKATLGPSDRSFYFDFYPYRSKDGGLFVSVAMFSQFNCIEPIFTRFDDPIGGSWDDVDRVFRQAAQLLENQLHIQVSTSRIGDGFDLIDEQTPVASWDELGLSLPERPAGAAAQAVDVELPTSWRLSEVNDGSPQLLFQFPAPLERYSGVVHRVSGELNLRASDDVNGATGFVNAQTSSVTMGEDGLDKAVRTKMIFADRFPEARFELKSTESSQPLAFGQITRMVAQGTFTMMGFDIPLAVRAQLEPVIGEDGDPRLQVQAGFELRLKAPFGIKGPDGPAPANDTLNFHLNVLLDPAPRGAPE